MPIELQRGAVNITVLVRNLSVDGAPVERLSDHLSQVLGVRASLVFRALNAPVALVNFDARGIQLALEGMQEGGLRYRSTALTPDRWQDVVRTITSGMELIASAGGVSYAFGFNYDAVLHAGNESEIRGIQEQVFPRPESGFYASLGRTPLFTSVHFRLVSEEGDVERQLNFDINVLSDTSIKAHLNVHYDMPVPRDETELVEKFERGYEEFIGYLDRLRETR